jgi:hypothetical protein
MHQSAAFRVCDKLRKPLSRLAGVAGFRSLLSRALALTHDDARWLKAVHVTADGLLEGLDETQGRRSKDEIAEGEIMLIAHLIALLVTFIGTGLTVRLVQEEWPHAAFNDLEA